MGSLHARMGKKVMSKNIATIDLGTNSIHLLIVQKTDQDKLHVLHDSSKVVRMGQSLRQTGCIHPDAVKRTQKVLQTYKAIIAKHACDDVYMTTTSAVRESKNQAEVLEQLHQNIDFQIDVITKEEEARLSYLSVVSESATDQPTLVADIGGGSTEIAWGHGLKFEAGQSVKIGTVKLLEGPLAKEKLQEVDIQQAVEEVQTHFHSYTPPSNIQKFYGTAGSFTQLASLEKKLEIYDPQAIDEFPLKKRSIIQWIERLSAMSLNQRRKVVGMHPDRADVSLAGTIIAFCLFDFLGTDTFFVRDRGVRYGKAFDILSPFTGTISTPTMTEYAAS